MYMNQALEPDNVVSEMNLLDSTTMPSMSAFHAQDSGRASMDKDIDDAQCWQMI
jgi:hypothetical protein